LLNLRCGLGRKAPALEGRAALVWLLLLHLRRGLRRQAPPLKGAAALIATVIAPLISTLVLELGLSLRVLLTWREGLLRAAA